MTAAPATWVLLRATGLVALAALTLAVAIGLAGPAVRAPAARLVAVTVHRVAAEVGLALTLAHVVLAVVDPWVDVSASATVLPGTSGWQPFWTGVGALSLDLLLVVAVSSAVRGRGPRAWWVLHALTYPAWLLAAAHALAVGTDSTSTAARVAAVVGGAGVGAAALARLAVTVLGGPVGVPAGPRAASGGQR